MKLVTKNVDTLKEDGSNARRHDAKNIETIKESLNRFGQQKPLVIDKNDVVRAGNGTLRAAKELGIQKLKCIVTELSDAELAAYAIVDNRSTDLSDWDDAILSDTLTKLAQESDDLLLSAGFSDVDLQQLLAKLELPEPPDDFPEVDETISTDFECPSCHYRWSGST